MIFVWQQREENNNITQKLKQVRYISIINIA